METTNRNQEIAKTIASQIGNKALYMIGAKNLYSIERGLQFDVMGNAKRITRVRIILNSDDLYTMKFYRGRGVNIAEAVNFDGIYCDQLNEIIESATGLYTKM